MLYVVGWMSIVVGVLHLGKASGALLLIIGTAIVFVVRKSEESEVESARKSFQANIKRLWRLRKTRKIAGQQSESDLSEKESPLLSNLGPKRKKTKKSDWFFTI
jgi:hypothetical protein